MVEKEFIGLRELLEVAGACKQPDKSTLESLLLPLSKDIEAVAHAKEANRKDRDWNNHHTALAEGAPAVGWVVVVSGWCCVLGLSSLIMYVVTQTRPIYSEYQGSCGVLW